MLLEQETQSEASFDVLSPLYALYIYPVGVSLTFSCRRKVINFSCNYQRGGGDGDIQKKAKKNTQNSEKITFFNNILFLA